MRLEPNPVPKDNRLLSIGLATAAAILLIIGAFSRHWLANPNLSGIGFGPMGCTACDLSGGRSEGLDGLFAEAGPMSNGAFVEMMRTMDPVHAEDVTSSAFAPMGWATFALSLAAALGLLVAAGLAFAKQRRDLPVAPTTVTLLSLMIGLLTACVFVATKPGGPGFVGVALGFWCFAIGAVMGIAAAQMIAKVLRPVDPDLLDGAMNPDQY